MARRITTSTQGVRPVEWRTSPVEEECPAQVPVVTRERNLEAQFATEIAELQRARQSESARARQEGFQEGLRQGKEQSAAEVKNASLRLADAMQEMAAFKKKMRREAEAEVVKLSLAIARRILHREVNADPDSIRGIVHAALEKLGRREILRVRVHTGAVQAIQAILEQAGSSGSIEVVADPRMAPGGLIFETSLGELDASVDTQLNEIQRGFADRLALS